MALASPESTGSQVEDTEDPWELQRLLTSHAVDRSGGTRRKVLLIDVKKAHCYPLCSGHQIGGLEKVYVCAPGENCACMRKLHGADLDTTRQNVSIVRNLHQHSGSLK